MIDVVIAGAAGRLGSRILALVNEAEDLRVVGALVEPNTPDVNRTLVEGVVGTSDLETIDRGVLIEAATRKAAMEHARQAHRARMPMVIATTGLDAKETVELEQFATDVPVLIASNLSLGVAVLSDLVARAAKALDGYHLEILELHHAKKRDAPSGTAWSLARAAAGARGQDIERDAILARGGETGPRGQEEIGLQSIRGGDIIGEHTVFFVGGTERLELTHRAATRDTFAAGAVVAARFIGQSDRKPGCYTIRDVLGLDPGSVG